MKPQETMPSPSQNIAFDQNGELMIRAELLDEPVPTVEVFNDRTILGHYVDGTGRERTALHDGFDWGTSFSAGSKLTLIETAPGEPSRTVVDGRYYDYQCSKPGTGSYELTATDQLIAVKTQFNPEYKDPITVLLPAGEPLPGEYGSASYNVLGVITADGKLITWGKKGKAAGRAVELALADKFVANRDDLEALEDELGGSSLLRVVKGNEAARICLEYFKERHGTDFSPTVEPHRR